MVFFYHRLLRKSAKGKKIFCKFLCFRKFHSSNFGCVVSGEINWHLRYLVNYKHFFPPIQLRKINDYTANLSRIVYILTHLGSFSSHLTGT